MDDNFEGRQGNLEDDNSSPLVQRYIQLLREKREGFFDVEEFGSIIDHYVDLFDLKEASIVIERGLLQHPRSFELSMRKAYIALLAGRADDCLRILSGFELLHPNDEELLMLKAEAFSQRGDSDRAIAIIESILNNSNSLDKVKLNIQLAELYTLKANLLESISCWKNAIQLEPGLDMAYLELRRAFVNAEIPEEGIRFFKGCTDKNPYSLPAWVELAECYLHLGELEKSIMAFDYALAIQDDHLIALTGKGSALFRQDEFSAALKTFEQLESILESDPTVLCSVGECHEQLENFAEADTFYLKALSIDPEHCEARLGHAIVSEHLGDSKKALHQMESVVGLEPDNSEYWFIFAELLSRNDSNEKSQLCFERALQLSENKLEYRLGQIDALIRAGDHTKALDKVQQSFEAQGDLEPIYHRGIKVLHELGQKTECMVLLEMLLERHNGKEELRAYYPDIFEDSEALQLLNCN